MRATSIFIGAILCCSSALSQQTPVLIETFTRAALVGMQLSFQRSYAQGRIDQARLACLMSIPESEFIHVVREVLANSLTPDEFESAEKFYSSAPGQAYARAGIAALYIALGVTPPESVPELSAGDQLAGAQFTTSPAGVKLIRDKVLESPDARQKLAAAYRSATEPCRK